MKYVIVPAGLADVPPGAMTYQDAEEAARLLAARTMPAVFLSDGLPEAALEAVAEAVRAGAMPVIEVRSARWDGGAWSPLSAACRGVVSGFGLGGIAAAVEAAAAD